MTLRHGEGRVVVLTETGSVMTAPFGDSHSRDLERLGLGRDYSRGDNAVFTRNILCWLGGSPDRPDDGRTPGGLPTDRAPPSDTSPIQSQPTMRRRADVGVVWSLLVLAAGLLAGAQCALYLYDRFDDGVAEPLSGVIGLVAVAAALALALRPYVRSGDDD